MSIWIVFGALGILVAGTCLPYLVFHLRHRKKSLRSERIRYMRETIGDHATLADWYRAAYELERRDTGVIYQDPAATYRAYFYKNGLPSTIKDWRARV